MRALTNASLGVRFSAALKTRGDSGIFIAAYFLFTIATKLYALIPNALIQISGNVNTTIAHLFSIFLEDFISLAIIVPLFLILDLSFNYRRLSIMLQGLILFGSLFVNMVGAKYFLMYELPFSLSHLQNVEGYLEMGDSIRGEFRGDVVYGTIVLSLWTALCIFLVNILHHTKKNLHLLTLPRAFWSSPRTTLSVLLISPLALFFACTTNIGEANLVARKYDLGFNTVYRLFRDISFVARRNDSDAKRLYSADDASVSAAGKSIKGDAFRWKIPVDSIEDRRLHPRFPFPDRGKNYNIVIYLFEGVSQRYIGLKAGGRAVVPNWERLARNSMTFEKHHATNPLTVNAIFSLLTSAPAFPADRWSIRHFPDISIRSLPEILHDAGYRTAFLNTGYFIYADQRLFYEYRNFDLLLDADDLKKPPYTKTLNWGIDDRALFEPAAKFVRADRGQPFFLMVKPESPHHPYDIPEDRFKLVDISTKSGYKERSFARYLNSLHYADYVLGKFVARIEKASASTDRETLFFILADHGEAFGQHRRNFNHPFYIYQENVHVPFLIYNRRLFRRPVQYSRLSRHEDIAPTILDILRRPSPREYTGVSLFRPSRERLISLNTTWRNDLMGIRDFRWKYIYNIATQKEELYELQSDPGEKNNLHRARPDIAKKYRRRTFSLRAYKRHYYEIVVGREIDWRLKEEKD